MNFIVYCFEFFTVVISGARLKFETVEYTHLFIYIYIYMSIYYMHAVGGGGVALSSYSRYKAHCSGRDDVPGGERAEVVVKYRRSH